MKPGVVSDVLEFGNGLARACDLADLERRYMHNVKSFVDMPFRGLYLLDPMTRGLQRAAVENMSDFFLNRYETVGRHLDPLLPVVLDDRRAVYNLSLMSLDDWLASPVYREVAGLHGCLHVIETPIIGSDDVIGTLNFADNRRERTAGRQLLDLAELLGRVVGYAVDVVRQRAASERFSRHALAALEMSGTPVIMSVSPDEPPWLNEIAKDLVRQLVRGSQIVYDAIARPVDRGPVTRDLAVELHDGRSGSLRVHARSPLDCPDAVVAVLHLSTGRPRMDASLSAALSPRERQVCELLVEGYTDREIAKRLMLSHNTVSQYVKQIYEKSHVRSRVELTRLALGLPATT